MPFVESWIGRREHEMEKANLPGLFDKHIPTALEVTRSIKMETVAPIMTINKVQTVCHLLDGLLALVPDNGKTPDRIERLFLFAAVWAFGGAAASDKTADFRKQFSQAWKAAFKIIKYPESGLVFDYFVSPANGELQAWADHVPEYSPVGMMQFTSIVVQTVDFVRLTI